jgi:hypothetical protein
MIIYSPTFTGSVQITGSQLVTGDLTVQGNLTAQTFILSSSVSYFTESFASGSTRFGDSPDDFMRVTGSLIISSSLGGPFVVTGSTGNVGIGVTPTAKLQVLTNSGVSSLFETQAGLLPLYQYRRSGAALANLTNTDAVASMEFIARANSSWLTIAKIYAEYSGNGTTQSGNLQFYTSNAGSEIERMRITSGGSVLIGTTTQPSAIATSDLLVIGKSGNTSNAINFSNGITTNWGYLLSQSNKMVFGSGTSSDIAFETNAGSERMRISGSGNVGIGTSSPGSLLHIFGAGSGNNVTYTKYTCGDGGDIRVGKKEGVSNDAIFGTWSNNDVLFYTNSTERIRFTSGGNVGIGTTSSVLSAKLSVMGTITAQSSGVDASYQEAYIAHYSSNPTESNAILTAVSVVAAQSGFQFAVSNGGGSAARTVSMTINRSSVNVVGALSKGSGTFKIDHPLESKKDTHHLVHSFVEGPRADLIYRGKVILVNGTAVVNIDETIGMTEGTFVALNRDVQCFTTNESGWDAIKGKVEGNILTITSQNTESTDEISWMVIGERQDKHMFDTEWTDENGRPILEPLKP